MTRTRDSRRPFCFECGNQLMYVDGEPLFDIRDYHGNQVRLHKECAKRFDKEKPTTAEPRRDADIAREIFGPGFYSLFGAVKAPDAVESEEVRDGR